MSLDNSRQWSDSEEKVLIELIQNKNSINIIGKKMNREPRLIEIRLQKIIYENVIYNGQNVKFVSSFLNLSEEEVSNHILSYKEYKKRHEKEKIKSNKNFVPNLDKTSEIELKMEKIEKENKFMKLILENRELHRRMDNLIKKGKMDKGIKEHILKNRQI